MPEIPRTLSTQLLHVALLPVLSQRAMLQRMFVRGVNADGAV